MPDTQAELMRELHDEHAGALWAYVVRLTGDRTAAQDVVQETLLRAWKTPAVLDGSRGSPRAWLFTVARRIVIDEWRMRRTRPETMTDTPPEGRVEDRSDEVLQAWVVAEALAKLSVEHRQVLVECYYRGRPVADAALRLGIPAGTVKSRTHYALKELRLALDEMGVGR